MITRIQIQGFKSLKDVDLALGDLNLFIGTNASGKSNLFDALRVLQGIGYGFTIEEILNGKPKSGTSEVWEGIRGGSGRAFFSGLQTETGDSGEHIIRLGVTIRTALLEGSLIEFSIGISPEGGCVREEKLSKDGSLVYDSSLVHNDPGTPGFKVAYRHGKKGTYPHKEFEKSRPVLHQILRRKDTSKAHVEVIQQCIQALSDTQRLDPIPAILRQYAQAQAVRRMGEHGENFAALIKTIIADEKMK